MLWPLQKFNLGGYLKPKVSSLNQGKMANTHFFNILPHVLEGDNGLTMELELPATCGPFFP